MCCVLYIELRFAEHISRSLINFFNCFSLACMFIVYFSLQATNRTFNVVIQDVKNKHIQCASITQRITLRNIVIKCMSNGICCQIMFHILSMDTKL